MRIILASVLFLTIICLSSCSDSTSSKPATVNLTRSSIQLSATDTIGSSDASLDCGCPCKLQDMKVSGDTSVIHFNLASLQDAREVHHITATAMPSHGTSGKTYTCTFSFVMHDPMEMGGMHDYPASITATFKN